MIRRIMAGVLVALFVSTAVPAYAATGTARYKDLVTVTVNKTLTMKKIGCTNLPFSYKFASELEDSDWLVQVVLVNKLGSIVDATNFSFLHFEANPALKGHSSLKACRNSWTDKNGLHAKAGTGTYKVVVLVQSFDSSSYQYVREGVSNTVSVSIKG